MELLLGGSSTSRLLRAATPEAALRIGPDTKRAQRRRDQGSPPSGRGDHLRRGGRDQGRGRKGQAQEAELDSSGRRAPPGDCLRNESGSIGRHDYRGADRGPCACAPTPERHGGSAGDQEGSAFSVGDLRAPRIGGSVRCVGSHCESPRLAGGIARRRRLADVPMTIQWPAARSAALRRRRPPRSPRSREPPSSASLTVQSLRPRSHAGSPSARFTGRRIVHAQASHRHLGPRHEERASVAVRPAHERQLRQHHAAGRGGVVRAGGPPRQARLLHGSRGRAARSCPPTWTSSSSARSPRRRICPTRSATSFAAAAR